VRLEVGGVKDVVDVAVLVSLCCGGVVMRPVTVGYELYRREG
jgi:hypothetical protein